MMSIPGNYWIAPDAHRNFNGAASAKRCRVGETPNEGRESPCPVKLASQVRCAVDEWRLFRLRRRTGFLAHAAKSPLRAHAAEKSNSQDGLTVDVRRCGVRDQAAPDSRQGRPIPDLHPAFPCSDAVSPNRTLAARAISSGCPTHGQRRKRTICSLDAHSAKSGRS